MRSTLDRKAWARRLDLEIWPLISVLCLQHGKTALDFAESFDHEVLL